MLFTLGSDLVLLCAGLSIMVSSILRLPLFVLSFNLISVSLSWRMSGRCNLGNGCTVHNELRISAHKLMSRYYVVSPRQCYRLEAHHCPCIRKASDVYHIVLHAKP